MSPGNGDIREHRPRPARDRGDARGRDRLLHELVERRAAAAHRAGSASSSTSWCPWSSGGFRVAPGRRNHAIAGLSMGGFGATFIGSQLPGYFGSASSFSGLLQHQRPQVEPALEAFGARYQDVFGPQSGFYATGHNSTRLAANLRATRLYVTVGNGTPEPGVPFNPARVSLRRACPRRSCAPQAEEFVAAARGGGRRHHLRPGGRGARLALLAPPPARGDRVGALPAGARGAGVVDVQDGGAQRRDVGPALPLRGRARRAGRLLAPRRRACARPARAR